jgi:lipoate-protein ligase B
MRPGACDWEKVAPESSFATARKSGPRGGGRAAPTVRGSASLVVHDLGLCAYAAALALQEELVARKIGGTAGSDTAASDTAASHADTDDHLLVLEHQPVYTLGRGADAADLLGADQRLGVPVFRVGRGGGVTFHGPGQLVAYPILTLAQAGRDVHGYVRRLEAVLIDVCAAFGIVAQRRDGITGVWVGAAKIASIGVGVRRWTTLHGIALNVSTDLRFFESIVTCRMPELRMTSMAKELRVAPAMRHVRAVFVERFRSAFGYAAETVAQACGG